VMRRVESRGALETAHRLMTIAAISSVTRSRRGAPNATFRRICAARCRPPRRGITHLSLTLKAWPRCYAPSTGIAARM
jgi:hypothetical protein